MIIQYNNRGVMRCHLCVIISKSDAQHAALHVTCNCCRRSSTAGIELNYRGNKAATKNSFVQPIQSFKCMCDKCGQHSLSVKQFNNVSVMSDLDSAEEYRKTSPAINTQAAAEWQCIKKHLSSNPSVTI
jgi:hypothetical protein